MAVKAYNEVIERRRLRVYIAGPISSDPFEGVHRGMAAAKRMFLDGLAPYCPHWDAFLFIPHTDEAWNAYMEWDLEYVALCEAVYRLSGESKGADLEVERAEELGIPVFYEDLEKDGPAWFTTYDYEGLLAYAKRRGLDGRRK